MLWLPLQATAGLAAHTRASHHAVQAQRGADAVQAHAQPHDHAQAQAPVDGHHAHAADVQAAHQADPAAGSAADQADGDPCADCVMCATALPPTLQSAGAGGAPRGAHGRVADEPFTSAACGPALEPPIAAA